MPMPLDPDMGSQPGMFPGEPAFVEAPEVGTRAKDLLYEINDLMALREAVDAGDVVLGYWFDTKPFKPESEREEHDTVGKTIKVPPFWRVFSGLDVLIQIRRDFWNRFAPEKRDALLYHELLHIEIVGEKRSVRMREHSIEEFAGVARRYGPWLPSREVFAKALQDHAAEAKKK